jgi:hypothetical protein
LTPLYSAERRLAPCAAGGYIVRQTAAAFGGGSAEQRLGKAAGI